jgi:hypothetical protein
MVSALLCSIDSFLASLGIGLLGCSEANRRTFIVAFAACDLSATLAAASLNSAVAQMHHGGLSIMLAPVVLAVVAAGMLANGRRLFFWLPILLSLDNFFTALLEGSVHGAHSPLIAGLASGLLAWSGFAVAQVARPVFSRESALAAGAGLLILAFVL